MIAGAAEGLGAAFALELAGRGMNLVLVDVNEEGTESLRDGLLKKYPIQIRTAMIDLGRQDAAEACLQAIAGIDCRLLIYNAAFSRVKPFLHTSNQELESYVFVNVRTPLLLTSELTRQLKENRQTGGILLMSSLAGIWGTRLVAAYSGTKAFNMLLAEALSHELRPFGIDVSACCAGATATPGYLGTHPAKGLLSPPVMNPARVASIALKKLGRKTIIIPGFMNRMNYFLLTRIFPRSLSVKMVNDMMARTYVDAFRQITG
jgi:hypothetical protein